MSRKSTQTQPTPTNSSTTETNDEIKEPSVVRNSVIVFVITAIAIAFGFFLYIFTHGTDVPYLGPIVGN